MKKLWHYALSAVYFFAFLGILFLPRYMLLIPFQEKLADLFFGNILGSMAEGLSGVSTADPSVSSDSVYMYLLLLSLAVPAIVLAVVFDRMPRWGAKREQLLSLFRLLFAYYLAFQLFHYGFDKVLKQQFYLPEPNTLYTPFGMLDKDLLFWSTMGLSYSYNFFTGLLEIITALLLMFRKTRLTGSILAVMIMGHITLLNFSFDISVKVYACFLLMLAVLICLPYLKGMYDFLVLRKEVKLKSEYLPASFPLRAGMKTLIIAVMLIEVIYPVARSGNWNDDEAERPYLHGVYQVITTVSGQDTLLLTEWPVKRFFVHRDGYLVFQKTDDRMVDYLLHVDQNRGRLNIMDDDHHIQTMDFVYQEADSLLTLQYTEQGKFYTLQAKVLNWKALPALRSQFHWALPSH